MSVTRYNLTCDCGHKGTLNMKENDQPFSTQWESWSVSNLDGESYYVKGYIGVDEAFERVIPCCPNCGTKLTKKHMS